MAAKKDYQSLSAELDEILAALQSTDIDIDDAIKTYERGIEVVNELEAYLKNAENKITKIKADLTRAKE